MLTADIVRSYPGDLKTLAFTPVLLPATNNTNPAYGEHGHINLAAKLYLLYKDTDIDFMLLSNASRSTRYGVDFSRNISTNFEIHGEWAYVSEVNKSIVSGNGMMRHDSGSAHNVLLGLRYLTENETTIIAEYYHNDAGYNDGQLEDYFHAVKQADASGNTALMSRLRQSGRQGYAGRNPGRNYFYFRASNKEPFDILYFIPSITSIINLDDRSYSLTPELLYTGIDDLELRLRATVLAGGQLTEFGEKINHHKLELRLRYFF
jgi:hypothetical protein